MTSSQALGIHSQSSRNSVPHFFILLGFMDEKIRKTFLCWEYLESLSRG